MADYQAAMLRRLNRHIVWSPDDLVIDNSIYQAQQADAVITQPDGTVSSSSAWLQSLENALMLNNAYFYTGLHWRTLGDAGAPTVVVTLSLPSELGLFIASNTLGLSNSVDTLGVLV